VSEHEPHVSATLVIEQLRAIETLVGTELVEDARRKIERSLATEFDALVPGAWVTTHAVERLYAMIAKLADRDLLALHREVVHASVERNLGGVWSVLLRVTSDRALLTRAAAIYQRSYDTGRLSAEIPAPGQGLIHLRQWPRVRELQLNGVCAGIEAVLSCAGRHEPAAEWRRTSEGAEFRARWRV
jgi:hypothetical protein